MKYFLLTVCCFVLALPPVHAQETCTLAPRLTPGEGGRIVFRDGSPHIVWTYPGIGPIVAAYYEGFSFVLIQRDPVCANGILWWEITVESRGVFVNGWLAEGADDVYFTEPLPHDQAEANVSLRSGLFYGRLWAIVERDRRGIFVPSGGLRSPQFITTSQHGLIPTTSNALYFWDETGLYQSDVISDDRQLLKGEQTKILDIWYSDFKGRIAVLYAEDCTRCYALYSLDTDPATGAVESTLIWRGKTDYPLVGIAGWTGLEDFRWVLEQDTERSDSPYPSSGGQLWAVTSVHQLTPLKPIPGSDQAIGYAGQWMAIASDQLRLLNLETRADYIIPLRYGDIAVLPMFSDVNGDLVWFELDFDGPKLNTVTLRRLNVDSFETAPLFTFDVRDGRLPVPQVVLSSREFTLLYHDSLMIFDMHEPWSTTWFPAPAPDILGGIWISGD